MKPKKSQVPKLSTLPYNRYRHLLLRPEALEVPYLAGIGNMKFYIGYTDKDKLTLGLISKTSTFINVHERNPSVCVDSPPRDL